MKGLSKAQEEKIAELILQVDSVTTAASGKTTKERLEKAETTSESMELSEAETRLLIDDQLRKYGWLADTNHLRYSNGTRPQKGQNLAIAEWPTDSSVGKSGYADYALFVGLQLGGIIEAKKAMADIPSVIDYQCKDYAKNIKTEHQKYVIKRFGQYMVPFLFATNGRDYFKQYEEKSGIWCLDVRSQFNSGKALPGWFSPEGIELALEKDIEEAKRQLLSTGYEVLQDPEGLNLRDYQVDAIKAAEKAIVQDKKTEVLLAMATGTGKTRTVLGMIYRFLSAKLFKRVLYLVDRTALGEQTADTFKTVKLEELKTLNKLYDIKHSGIYLRCTIRNECSIYITCNKFYHYSLLHITIKTPD